MIAAIVAADLNNGIGYNNELLVHIPKDLKRFKEITSNNIVIMGRNTWESLGRKRLPDRVNVVITRESFSDEDYGVVFAELDEIKLWLSKQKDNKNEHIFIIGGEFIYNKLLEYCDTIYMTRIFNEFENVDRYFPNIDWPVESKSEVYKYKDYTYQFVKHVKELN